MSPSKERSADQRTLLSLMLIGDVTARFLCKRSKRIKETPQAGIVLFSLYSSSKTTFFRPHGHTCVSFQFSDAIVSHDNVDIFFKLCRVGSTPFPTETFYLASILKMIVRVAANMCRQLLEAFGAWSLFSFASR